MTVTRTQHLRIDRSDQTRPARRGRDQGRAEPAARAGSAADGADRGAAAGAQDRRTCLQGRRGAGDADLLRRGGDAGALPVRPGQQFRPCRRLALRGDGEGLRRQHRAARHRRRQSDAAVRARTRPRSRAPARPIRSPISRRWRRSSVSTSTGTSSPIRACPGRSRFSRTTKRMSRWRNSRTRSSPPRASTTTIRSRPGTKHNATLREPHRVAERPALQRAALFRTRHRPHDRACRRP